MPLRPPCDRQPIQTRRIECASFRRSDGLWDIEGHLTDTAAYSFPNEFRGEIRAGEPIHDMWIRLTVDAAVEIRAVEAAMDAGPYPVCPAIVPAFRKLEGLRIGPGWNRTIRELLGGVRGCVHMVDLLRPVATVAFKTVKREAGSAAAAAADDGPYQIDTCHALAGDGEIVRRRWPDRYTGQG